MNNGGLNWEVLGIKYYDIAAYWVSSRYLVMKII